MSRKNKRRPKTGSQFFIIAGLALLVFSLYLFKGSLEARTEHSPTSNIEGTQYASSMLPEDQLDQALEQGLPILAFFHSLTCTPCKQMTGIVEEVYPEFENQVVLVDVDVYDQKNQPLLRKASIRTIPTVIFIDRNGQGQTYIGVMPADQLKATLSGMAGR
jgi:thioredoxin 1